ncbi:DUF1707 domain-containing protein [Rhodococcus sp. ABRD24]|uniref:DUF1707 SHOCT-like domain-containing protein n=1 Tax=Rhodococcus sp. ABRD24 TaxID=2507582 RepID=UPI001F61137A|nr:DUF1707 domain-containing protein [Rhodococcus sp. ABRD24]
MTATTRVRARDVDRAVVCDALDTAYADGQLSDVEHRKRVHAARAARTLDDLDRLVRDLQAHSPLRDSVLTPPPPRSPRWILALAAAVVLVCGVAVVASATQDHIDAAGGAAGADLTTATGLGQMLDDIDRQLGSSEVDSLTIYPEYASISRPVPGAPGSEQSYRYEDGKLTDEGRSPGRTEGVPVDLAKLRPNVSRLIGLLKGADRTLGVDDPTQIYLIADRDDDAGPVVSIYLRNEDTGSQGFLTADFDGVVRSVYRSDR